MAKIRIPGVGGANWWSKQPPLTRAAITIGVPAIVLFAVLQSRRPSTNATQIPEDFFTSDPFASTTAPPEWHDPITEPGRPETSPEPTPAPPAPPIPTPPPITGEDPPVPPPSERNTSWIFERLSQLNARNTQLSTAIGTLDSYEARDASHLRNPAARERNARNEARESGYRNEVARNQEELELLQRQLAGEGA